MPAHKRKTCAFCQRSDQKISKEDVVPKWIVKLLPQGTKCEITTPDGSVIGKWKIGPNGGLTINDVCRACNHGWMADTEKDVKPFLPDMIIGKETVLKPKDAMALVVWIYKTVMAFDLVRRNIDKAYFTPEERQRYSAMSPIEGRMLFIWLASYTGKTHEFTLTKRLLKANVEIRPFIYDNQVYTATISIGQIAFQILTFRVEKQGKGLRPFRPEWDKSTIRIWPLLNEAVTWPPAELLSDVGLIAFRERWMDKTVAAP